MSAISETQVVVYRASLKKYPPLFHTTLSLNQGRGLLSNMQLENDNVSYYYYKHITTYKFKFILWEQNLHILRPK